MLITTEPKWDQGHEKCFPTPLWISLPPASSVDETSAIRTNIRMITQACRAPLFQRWVSAIRHRAIGASEPALLRTKRTRPPSAKLHPSGQWLPCGPLIRRRLGRAAGSVLESDQIHHQRHERTHFLSLGQRPNEPPCRNQTGQPAHPEGCREHEKRGQSVQRRRGDQQLRA